MIKIFEVFYNTHKLPCEPSVPGFIPYLNIDKSIYLENQCLVDITKFEDLSNDTHVGVVGRKFHDKVTHRPSYDSICNTISNRPDVDIFSPGPPENWWFEDIQTPKPLYWTNQCGIKETAISLLQDIASAGLIDNKSINYWNIKYPKAIYCNYWIAKTGIFIDYTKNFLPNVFQIISTYGNDHPVMKIDSHYPDPPPEIWKQATGFANYPGVTFILERLINIYTLDRKLNHENII